jgi:hypothetical protein
MKGFRVSVDGATHTQKDDVESNEGSLENVAEIFVLFFCNVQLVLGCVSKASCKNCNKSVL